MELVMQMAVSWIMVVMVVVVVLTTLGVVISPAPVRYKKKPISLLDNEKNGII